METMNHTQEATPEKKPLAVAVEGAMKTLEERLHEKGPSDIFVISGREHKVSSPLEQGYADIQAATLIAKKLADSATEYRVEQGARKVEVFIQDFEKVARNLAELGGISEGAKKMAVELVEEYLKTIKSTEDVEQKPSANDDKYLVQQSA